jgi:hemoglobin/transferrin/lactoferrin receptor protein
MHVLDLDQGGLVLRCLICAMKSGFRVTEARNRLRNDSKMHHELDVLAPRGLALLLCGVLGIAGSAWAQDAQKVAHAESLEEIVVVAHRIPRARRDVAANITVFTNENSGLELAQTVADVLRYTPGIDFESAGTRFGAESINIRGISGNRVAIRFDGVPISDHFNVGSFANATRDLAHSGFVTQIEVLHGPASAMYGSSAIGGVVSMRTLSPEDIGGPSGLGGRLISAYDDASNGSSVSAMQALRSGPIALAAGIAYQRRQGAEAAAVRGSVDGYDLNGRSGYANLSFEDFRGGEWHARFYQRVNKAESALDSLLGTGRFRSTTVLEGEDEQHTEIVNLEYRTQELVGLDYAVMRAYYHASDTEQRTYDERGMARRPVAIDRLFVFNQDSRGLEASLLKSLKTGAVSHELGFGFDYRGRRTREYRDGTELGLDDGLVTQTILGETFPLRDFPLTETREWGAYLEDTIRVGRWSLITALRRDQYDMNPTVDAMYVEDYPFVEPVAISASETSPKLGIIGRLSPSTEVYLQYAHGFRAPPFEDANISLDIPLFNVRAVPNPDLRAERSDGLDAGIRWHGDQSNAYISLFYTEYEDFIESRVNVGVDHESGRILFQSRNIDRADIAGIEAGFSSKLESLLHGLSLEARLFAARGRDRRSNAPLNSVGPTQAVIGLNLGPEGQRWRAALRGTFTNGWTERDETAGELFEPPGHAVFDLYLEYRASRNVTLRAGLRNLTDRTFWSWTDVRNLPPGDPAIPYVSQPGRSVTAGIDIDW